MEGVECMFAEIAAIFFEIEAFRSPSVDVGHFQNSKGGGIKTFKAIPFITSALSHTHTPKIGCVWRL
jgi:hypothetical protein